MMRALRWIATAFCAVLVLGWIGFWIAGSGGAPLALLRRAAGLGAGAPGDAGVALPAGLALGGPFALTDQTGRRVTDADFRGRWLLVYFGYTTCPDVCPTELQTIARALDALGPKGEAVTPVFVTIDPDRDTPSVLAAYIAQFSDRMVGLTGSAQEIARIAREYRVYYAKAPARNNETYLVDHSSFVYLMDPDGRLRGLFRPDTTADALAADIGRRL